MSSSPSWQQAGRQDTGAVAESQRLETHTTRQRENARTIVNLGHSSLLKSTSPETLSPIRLYLLWASIIPIYEPMGAISEYHIMITKLTTLRFHFCTYYKHVICNKKKAKMISGLVTV